MFQHLLVALDGSELADKALKVGLELAKTHSSKMTIITSTDRSILALEQEGLG